MRAKKLVCCNCEREIRPCCSNSSCRKRLKDNIICQSYGLTEEHFCSDKCCHETNHIIKTTIRNKDLKNEIKQLEREIENGQSNIKSYESSMSYNKHAIKSEKENIKKYEKELKQLKKKQVEE